jgi:hypothetical protein
MGFQLPEVGGENNSIFRLFAAVVKGRVRRAMQVAKIAYFRARAHSRNWKINRND